MRHAVNILGVDFRTSTAQVCLLGSAVALLILTVGDSASAQNSTRTRQLAQGVLTTIPPDLTPEDTVSTHDVVEIRANPALEWAPEFLAASDTLVGMSSATKFRREVWGLEFSFKPLRMIELDVPTRSGGAQRMHVWYLVYRVRNTGETLVPSEGEGGVFSATPSQGKPRRFVPEFVLESHDRASSGGRAKKSYLDRIIPTAVAAISRRETPGRRLLNTVEMAQQTLPVSGDRIDRSLWGVATWTDIDPRMDFYSVYVGGLTNAYRWDDQPGAYRPGDPIGRGRRFARKMLQLNFWRPGDEFLQSEREIRYGVPLGKSDLYDVGDGVAHRWVYR
jgi:hypothetical protein